MNAKYPVKVIVVLFLCCLAAANSMAANYNFGNSSIVTNLTSDTESLGQHFIATKGKNVYMVVDYAATYFIKSTDGGNTFSAPVWLGCGNDPAISLAKDGTIYIACFYGGGETYLMKSTDEGISFSTPLLVGYGYETSIAIDGGDIYVTSSSYIYKSNDGGSTFTRLSTTFGNYEDPHFGTQMVVTAKGGKLYVAWRGYHDGKIYFSQSPDGGLTFSEVKNVSENISGTSYPSIVVTDNSKIYIAWGANGLYVSESTDQGGTFTTTMIGGQTAGTQSPSIAADLIGNVYVAWQINQGSSSDVYFTMKDERSNVFTTPNRISEGRFPSITINGYQDALIAYGKRSATNISKSTHCTD